MRGWTFSFWKSLSKDERVELLGFELLREELMDEEIHKASEKQALSELTLLGMILHNA